MTSNQATAAQPAPDKVEGLQRLIERHAGQPVEPLVYCPTCRDWTKHTRVDVFLFCVRCCNGVPA